MNSLLEFGAIAVRDHGLCVMSTHRNDGHIHSTVVNAGVVEHPLTGDSVVAVITDARSGKVANLRVTPRATVSARADWSWTTVEGDVEVIDVTLLGRDPFCRLLRDVSAAAIGGTPENWRAHVDGLNLDDHAVVLITPVRVYSGKP
jgi:hypothetical protein